MSDPLDDMIRQASEGEAPGGATPKRTRPAMMILIGLAVILLALPLILALTAASESDLLWNLATGDPASVILGGQ